MAEQKFEEALKDLEQIVDNLESGELNLDEAIKRYEEGIKLSNFCNRRLSEIQKRIEVLVKDPSGILKTKNFSDAGAEEDKEPLDKPARKPAVRKKRPKGEKLLF